MCGCYDNDVIVDRSGLDTVSGEHGNVYIDVQDGSGGDHIFAGAGYNKVCADSGDYVYEAEERYCWIVY